MSKLKVTKEALIELYINDPYATHESVAEKLGASRAAVIKGMRRYGLESRNTAGKPRVEIPELSDKAWLEQKFIKENLTATNIGKMLGGISQTTVLNTLREHGIDTQRKVHPLLADKRWLEEQYVVNQRTYDDIGQEIGSNKYAVYRAVRGFGIRARGHTSKYSQLNDKEWLRKKYVDERLSTKQIADILGTTVGNVHSALTHSGVPTRGYKEGLSTRFPEGRLGENHPNWKGGLPICADCEKQIGYGHVRCADCEKRNNRFGEKNGNFKGAITKLFNSIRSCREYKAWRKAVLERDNYICTECGASRESGAILHADHKKSFYSIIKKYEITNIQEAKVCEELWDITNGRTLCKPCHENTPNFAGRAWSYID